MIGVQLENTQIMMFFQKKNSRKHGMMYTKGFEGQNYGETRLDDQSIHIPRIGRNRKVILQLFWDRFRCVDRMGELIYEGPRPYIDESQEIDWIEVFKSYRQKPRLIIYSKYQKFIPQKIKSYLLETSLTERKTRTD